MMNRTLLIVGIIATALISSCVPARKFDEVKKKQQSCESELSQLKLSHKDLESQYNEVNAAHTELKKRHDLLVSDTTSIGKSLRQMTTNYDKLNETYELLLSKNKELLAGNAAETKKLAGQLQLTQEELQRKEDALKALEKELNAKSKTLDELSAELQKREAKVKELEDILSKKEAAVKELKKKVSDALLGFENNGLTVNIKNGKVYVSLEESLLFASGKWAVSSKGIEVLKKLGKVLEQNEDINVMVEGHTDDVPMRGAGDVKDNWDLSVMRATSVTKIILENSKVNPLRITAAGHGEFMPLENAKTPDARAKNRRTEIILTPKLDELFQMLESN
jgi:chemotaxis protein MotB